MANTCATTRRVPHSTNYRSSVQLRETLRRQRQQQIVTLSQPQFPWEILAWGLSAALFLWVMTYVALLPVIVNVIPLLHS